MMLPCTAVVDQILPSTQPGLGSDLAILISKLERRDDFLDIAFAPPLRSEFIDGNNRGLPAQRK